MLTDIMNRFFSERSFSLRLKIGVFLLSLTLFTIIALGHLSGKFPPAESRLVLYVFFLIIFADTFFCGFIPGMVFAFLSSMLAVSVFIPNDTPFDQISATELEILPFIALYFLVAITVDWFRENIEQLKEQLDENKRLQEQARHMEKLALAGEIAAGIAHEIRNPLTVIQGYLQLMSTKCEKMCNDEESYQLLIDELKRANQIISDFLRFSRPDKPKKEMAMLTEIIEDTVSLVYGEAMRRGIKLFIYPAPDLPDLCLDRDQMVQVFLNLFRNAVQAMTNGGKISVYTSAKKDCVTVKIIDSGTGMQSEISEKIFSPFYTTKEEGTGLGLAITQTIIFAHRHHRCGNPARSRHPVYHHVTVKGRTRRFGRRKPITGGDSPMPPVIPDPGFCRLSDPAQR